MISLRTLRLRHFHQTLKTNQCPLQYFKTLIHSSGSSTHNFFSNFDKSPLLPLEFQRSISNLANPETESIDSGDCEDQSKKTKKPLHVLFREAVGLSGETESGEIEDETKELSKKLRKLEEEVRRLKGNGTGREKLKKKKKTEREDKAMNTVSNSRSLYALFRNKEENPVDVKDLKVEEPKVYKELSPDMVLFASHLYREGYFKDANFLSGNEVDAMCFLDGYSRDFLKFAAEKFGKDNLEIAKWLSGSDLKKVAHFGCPSLAKKTVFSAKKLRTFFGIQEDTVCGKCVLKESCKFANQSVWKGDTKNLNLAVVMRVITLYAMEAVHPQLVVTDEVKASVGRLLKEVLRLSKTIS